MESDFVNQESQQTNEFVSAKTSHAQPLERSADKFDIDFLVTAESDRFVISPDNKYLLWWKWFHVIVIMFDTAYVVLNVGVHYQHNSEALILIYVTDIVWVINMTLSFFIAYHGRFGNYINKSAQIRQHYLKSRFLIDSLAVFPTDFFMFLVANRRDAFELLMVLRINRILRVYQLFYTFSKFEEEIGKYSLYYKLAKYILLTPITVITLATIAFVIACDTGYDDDIARCRSNSWAFEANNTGFSNVIEVVTDSTTNRVGHLRTFYWITTILSSTGFGDIVATTTPERWFVVLVMIVGTAFFFGVVSGSLAALFTSLAYRKIAFFHRFEKITQELSQSSCDDIILNQLVEYYQYLWKRKHGIDTKELYRRLPFSFQAEVAYRAHERFLKKVKIFDGLNMGFLRMLSLRIKASLYLPSQIVVTRGETSPSMFYIRKGTIDVLAEDESTPLVRLGRGKLFGEIYLIYLLPRTSTLRALTHCELLRLGKKDVFSIASQYPHHLERILAAGRTRCEVVATLISVSDDDLLTIDALDLYSFTSNFRRSFQVNAFNTGKKLHPLLAKLRKRNHSLADELHFLFASNSRQSQQSSRRLSSIDSRSLHVKHDASERKSIVSARSQNIPLYADGESLSSTNSFTFEKHISKTNLGLLLSGGISKYQRYLRGPFALVLVIMYPLCASYLDYLFNPGKNSLAFLVIFLSYVVESFFVKELYDKVKHKYWSNVEVQTYRKLITKKNIGFNAFVVAPFEIFAFVAYAGDDVDLVWQIYGLLKLNRLLGAVYLMQELGKLEDVINLSLKSKEIIRAVTSSLIIMHTNACFAYLVACFKNECTPDSWLLLLIKAKGEKDIQAIEYFSAVYWVMTILSSTGYGDVIPGNDTERIFASFVQMSGWFMYSYSAGIITAALTNLDAPRVKFQSKLSGLNTLMSSRHVDHELQRRVRNYLKIMWERYGGEWLPGVNSLIAEAPINIQEDIAMQNYFWLLNQTTIFHDLDEAFLRALSSRVIPCIFAPDEPIVYAGDLCQEMYILKSGVAVFLTPVEENVIEYINAGQCIGVLSMLFRDYQIATVRAKTYIEALEITMEDFQAVVQKFPLIKDQFVLLLKRKAVMRKARHELARAVNALDVRSKDQEATLILQPWFQGPKRKRLVQSLRHDVVINDQPRKEFTAHVGFGRPVLTALANLLMPVTFFPESIVFNWFVWSQVVIGVIQAITVPVMMALLWHSTLLHGFHWSLDVIGWLNLYLGFHMGFIDSDGVTVYHPVDTAKSYYQTNFIVDLISILPLELVALIVAASTNLDKYLLLSLFKVNRVLQIYRLESWFNVYELNIILPTAAIRLVRFMIYSVILLTWQASIMFMLACPPEFFLRKNVDAVNIRVSDEYTQACYHKSWIVHAFFTDETNGNFSDRQLQSDGLQLFTYSYYFTVTTSLGVGYGDAYPQNIYEMMYAAFVMLSGVIFFVYLTATVTSSFASLDLLRSKFQEALRASIEFLNFQGFTKEYRDTMKEYYSELWIKTKGTDIDELIKGLTSPLYSDLTYQLYGEILESIPFFVEAEASFLKNLARYVKPVFFLQGQIIVHKDDIGAEVFYIYSGEVESIAEDEEVVLDRLAAGSIFGQDSWFFNQPRPTTIRARSNCNLLILSKAALEVVLVNYPSIRRRFAYLAHVEHEKAFKQKQDEKGLLNGVPKLRKQRSSISGILQSKLSLGSQIFTEYDPETFLYLSRGSSRIADTRTEDTEVVDFDLGQDETSTVLGVGPSLSTRPPKKLPALILPKFVRDLAIKQRHLRELRKKRHSQIAAIGTTSLILKRLSASAGLHLLSPEDPNVPTAFSSAEDLDALEQLSLLEIGKVSDSGSSNVNGNNQGSTNNNNNSSPDPNSNVSNSLTTDGKGTKNANNCGKSHHNLQAASSRLRPAEGQQHRSKSREFFTEYYKEITMNEKRERFGKSSPLQLDSCLKTPGVAVESAKMPHVSCSELQKSCDDEDEKYDQIRHRGGKVGLEENQNASARSNWPVNNHDWQMNNHEWQVNNHDWLVNNHDCQMNNCGWQMNNHDWQMNNHNQQMNNHNEWLDSEQDSDTTIEIPEELESNGTQASEEDETKEKISLGIFGHWTYSTLSPKTKSVVIFGRFIFALKVIYVLWTFLAACFYTSTAQVPTVAFLYTCDLIFIVEMLMKCVVQIYNESGTKIVRAKEIRWLYFRNLNYDGFAFDLICLVPMEIMCVIAANDRYEVIGGFYGLWRFLRIKNALRLLQIFSYFKYLDQSVTVSVLTKRFLSVTFPLLITVHTLACIWHLFACYYITCEESDWLTEFKKTKSVFTRYSLSVYWCLVTMTSTGFGDIRPGKLIYEQWYTMVCMMAGKIYVGLILANIASSLTIEEETKYNYDKKLDSLKTHMDEETVPRSIQMKVLRYYRYLWRRNKDKPLLHLFDDLPVSIRSEILYTVSVGIFNNVPIFENTPVSFQREVSRAVRLLKFMPDDYIVCKGDIGTSLKYIHRGVVIIENITVDSKPILLKAGQFFGEINLFVNEPRQTTAKALTYVDLLTLSKKDLSTVLKHFPQMDDLIFSNAKKRFGNFEKTNVVYDLEEFAAMQSNMA